MVSNIIMKKELEILELKVKNFEDSIDLNKKKIDSIDVILKDSVTALNYYNKIKEIRDILS